MNDDIKKSARVVYVISEKFLVLNVGTNYGVKEGERFEVYELSEEIIDPETRENLGRLKLFHGIGEVVFVQEKMCIISSFPDKRIIALMSAACFSSAKVGDRAELVERE